MARSRSSMRTSSAERAGITSPSHCQQRQVRRPMSSPTDAELYLRGRDTLLASWEAYARGADGAALHRLPGVAAAVFPAEPERAVYNNALLDRDLGADERSGALDAMEAVYAAAGSHPLRRLGARERRADARRAGTARLHPRHHDAGHGHGARRHRRAPPADPATPGALARVPDDGGPAARFPRHRRPRRLPPAGGAGRRRDWSRRPWRTTSAATAASTTSGRSRRPGGAAWAPR